MFLKEFCKIQLFSPRHSQLFSPYLLVVTGLLVSTLSTPLSLSEVTKTGYNEKVSVLSKQGPGGKVNVLGTQEVSQSAKISPVLWLS